MREREQTTCRRKTSLYPTHPPSCHPQTRFRGRVVLSLCSFYCSSLIRICSLCDFFGAPTSWDRPGRRVMGSLQWGLKLGACNVPPPRGQRTADGKTGQNVKKKKDRRAVPDQNLSKRRDAPSTLFQTSLPNHTSLMKQNPFNKTLQVSRTTPGHSAIQTNLLTLLTKRCAVLDQPSHPSGAPPKPSKRRDASSTSGTEHNSLFQ